MDLIQNLALAGGLSWASGLRVYMTVFAVGFLAKFGYIDLPAALDILSNPVVIGVSGILAVIEFLADKIPYVDSAWDSIQTFICIPAGALLAMGAINTSDPAIATVAASLGEESLLLTGGWLVFALPAVFIGLLFGFVLLLCWLLPKVWRGVKSVLGSLGKINQTQ